METDVVLTDSSKRRRQRLTMACKRYWRLATLAAFILATLGGTMVFDPIPQDAAYHTFADQRPYLGIPNFFDVISNIPFALVGLVGLRAAQRLGSESAKAAWFALFVGVVCVSAGSAYYHWAPNNQSLVWDRLPMTIGFMGLLVALLGEYIDVRLVKFALTPAVLVGASSVLYWHVTDDLRFYAWIQFMPLGVVAFLLICFASRFTHSWLLIVALAWYVLAKLCESYDAAIFQMLQKTVSGHTIKHLLAAAGCLTLVALLDKRRLRI